MTLCQICVDFANVKKKKGKRKRGKKKNKKKIPMVKTSSTPFFLIYLPVSWDRATPFDREKPACKNLEKRERERKQEKKN